MVKSAPNRKHILSLSSIFWFGYFPRSKINFESRFLVKSFIINDIFFWDVVVGFVSLVQLGSTWVVDYNVDGVLVRLVELVFNRALEPANTCNRKRLTTLVPTGCHVAGHQRCRNGGCEVAVRRAPVPVGPGAPAPLFTLKQLHEAGDWEQIKEWTTCKPRQTATHRTKAVR